jgi:hypothetical protein
VRRTPGYAANRLAVISVALAALLACAGPQTDPGDEVGAGDTGSEVTSTTPSVPMASSSSSSTVPEAAPSNTEPTVARPAPDWLGERPLPTLEDGRVPPQTTPAELRNRSFETVDRLPPPDDGRFAATIGPVTETVLARSTWKEGCPVEPDELRYLTLSFWGFDERAHTGEMLVHVDVAEDIVEVFAALYAARFPIEEMRIVTEAELVAPPLGDGNNTTAFVCRNVVGGSSTVSQHAYGLAIDINPFHNPYRRGDLVLPELATDYLDRSPARGVIVEGDLVVEAFDAIGWGWGGRWNSLVDYQHFSRNGR